MIRINQIKLRVGYEVSELEAKIKKALKGTEIKSFKIVRKSIDARDKNNVLEIVSVDVILYPNINEELLIKKLNNNNIMSTNETEYRFPYTADMKQGENIPEKYRPVIIGAGPAGYFCALKLAEAGFRPVLFERGKCVEERNTDVENFWSTGKLNTESNVSFGEGGAGTFSDGKLFTGIKDKSGRIREVLKVFYENGAKEDILYNAKPHIGTDILKNVMKNMRNRIKEYGGEIHFNCCLKDINTTSNSEYLYELLFLNTENHEEFKLNANILILAIGHSAGDTFKMLYEKHFNMEPKPFAVGLRIEHKRKMIDENQYGPKFAELLPAADYKMTHKTPDGRSVFSFCMCPGGFVVNASSEEGRMVVNGMSNNARNEENSNSAIVCSVTPEDFPGESPMDALKFQKSLEERFYKAGEGNIPVQTFGDFKKNVKTTVFGEIKPNTKGKYSPANLRECLPDYISSAIISSIMSFDDKIKGFASDDAILSGIESRTSSPVRILRDENHMSNFEGIFLCGEGAGYAGGITSSAVDGIKTAEKAAYYIINKR